MFLLEDTILTKEDCNNLVGSIIKFNRAELFYNGNNGERISTYIPTQRKALKSELELIQGSNLYQKINLTIERVGFQLKSEKIKYQVVRYQEGDFIYKHRHDMDGGIFLTIVIQLNDYDEYEGGEFLYWIDGVEHTLNKKIGHGVLIGPEVEHEVKVVEKGVRHSLVLFLEYSDLESLSKQSLI